jgi:predicted house-cleaning noncanonical NTP pyrophosphatase (MazG superfamily)
MNRTTYNKLVRDRIPEHVRAKGVTVKGRTLPLEKRLSALLQKVEEEAKELQNAPPEKRAEELADLLEILQAIAAHASIAWNDVVHAQEKKRAERGGFTEGIFLEYTEE